MTQQGYKHHVRYYVPHHFVFYPLASMGLGYCMYAACMYGEHAAPWYALGAVFFLLLALAFMLRQHYALILQNRMIKLEMRFRYYILTHRRFETLEKQLSDHQIYALRFASDGELVALIQRTIAEELPPNLIKQSIKDWQVDDMRV